MRLYCGIDLHSNNSVISIIDETDRIMFEKKVDNDLELILSALEPHREELVGIVVESICIATTVLFRSLMKRTESCLRKKWTTIWS